MAPYRELAGSAQTAYAELLELAHVAEAARSPAFVSGAIQWKTISGKRYAYWAFKEVDGRKREYYLGPDGPAIDAIESARAQGAPALDAVARQAGAARAHGCTLTPPKHYRIVKRLAEYQFFRAGGLLIGTHAFLAIGNQLGVSWSNGTRTLDLDFAHRGPGGNVSVALPATVEADADSALRSLEMGFLPAFGGSKGLAAQYASGKEPDLRVDFLTVERRRSDPVHAPSLGVALMPMKFLDYLLEDPGQAVLIDRADACLVNLPDPARYALHKLIVAAERGARHPKYRKDLMQAGALIAWHLANGASTLDVAWGALHGRGRGWTSRARASLAAMPKELADVRSEFLKMIRS